MDPARVNKMLAAWQRESPAISQAAQFIMSHQNNYSTHQVKVSNEIIVGLDIVHTVVTELIAALTIPADIGVVKPEGEKPDGI